MFRPDPRVGDRQHACNRERCQQQRRAKTQASWRSRNPSYQSGYRLKKRSAATAAGRKASAPSLRPPPELALFPWDVAKTEFGFARADLVAYLALLVVRLVKDAKDQRLAEKRLSMQVYGATGRDS